MNYDSDEAKKMRERINKDKKNECTAFMKLCILKVDNITILSYAEKKIKLLDEEATITRVIQLTMTPIKKSRTVEKCIFQRSYLISL